MNRGDAAVYVDDVAMKAQLKWLLKCAALPMGLLPLRRARGVFFLTYHKVEGRFKLDMDLPAALFRRQAAFLAGQHSG